MNIRDHRRAALAHKNALKAAHIEVRGEDPWLVKQQRRAAEKRAARKAADRARALELEVFQLLREADES